MYYIRKTPSNRRLFVTWWSWRESNPRPKIVPRTDVYSLFHTSYSASSDEQTLPEAFDGIFMMHFSNKGTPLSFISYTQPKPKGKTWLAGCKPVVRLIKQQKQLDGFHRISLLRNFFQLFFKPLRSDTTAVCTKHIPVETMTAPCCCLHIIT